MKKIKIKVNNMDEIVSEMEGIPFEEIGEHPLVKQLNELSMNYLDRYISENYGENYIMGSSEGGFCYEMECDQLIDVGDDGEKEEHIDLD